MRHVRRVANSRRNAHLRCNGRASIPKWGWQARISTFATAARGFSRVSVVIHVHSIGFPPRFPRGLKWPLLGWLLAEVVAFLFVVHLIGLGGAILLGLATTI